MQLYYQKTQSKNKVLDNGTTPDYTENKDL